MRSKTILRIIIIVFLSFVLVLSTISASAQNPLQPVPAMPERVSISTDGEQGNSFSYEPSISPDGRFVAFVSDASNLVDGDTNGVEDIFVHDRQTGETFRVSVSSSSEEANRLSDWPSVSADGRFVAFMSLAYNLVDEDTNGYWDIFVHDRQTGETTRASLSSSFEQGDSNSYSPVISADGNVVAFDSDASNLVSGDTNGSRDVFVRDRQVGETLRVSVSSSGAQGDFNSFSASISSDGNYLAFASWASNLVDGDTNNNEDIFLHDRQSGETTRVSVSSSGQQGDLGSWSPSISADGRYVVFISSSTNLVDGDVNGVPDVFVHDSLTGQTTLVSVSSIGEQGNNLSFTPSISTDGRFVAFMSLASNLVDGDTNNVCDTDGDWIYDDNCPDIFLHDMQTGVTTRYSVSSTGEQGNNESRDSAISANGRFVAFDSLSSNLVAGDTNDTLDVFVQDRVRMGNPLYFFLALIIKN